MENALTDHLPQITYACELEPQPLRNLFANPDVIPFLQHTRAAVGIGIQNAFTEVFGAQNLTATLSALEQSGESQTLSAPRLTVLNNRPATISDWIASGIRIPSPTTRTQNTAV